MREIVQGVVTWPSFSEPHGYDFNGYFLRHPTGNLCIDPVDAPEDVLALLGREGVARILITNDARAITDYRVDGNQRQALFSVHTEPVAAAISAPPYLAALINEAARTHGVDPRLVAAVAARESAWNASAVSRTGACGIMQLMPATARHLGIKGELTTDLSLALGASAVTPMEMANAFAVFPAGGKFGEPTATSSWGLLSTNFNDEWSCRLSCSMK